MQRWRLGFGFPAAEENSGSFVNGRRTYTFFFRPSGKHVEASGGCESSLVETLRGVLLASTVGLTLGTTTKLNWARWLPVCGCPHVLLLRLFENGNNHATNTLQASQHLSTQTPFRRASHSRRPTARRRRLQLGRTCPVWSVSAAQPGADGRDISEFSATAFGPANASRLATNARKRSALDVRSYVDGSILE